MSGCIELGGGQSPIDISGWTASDAPPPVFAYAGDANRVERAQSFVIFHFEPGSRLLVGGEPYRLLQCHWHTPAEHTVEGQEFDAEVHFVHINQREQLLVVGALYQIGEADAALQQIIEAATPAGEAERAARPLPAADLAPASHGFYRYTGSLTAPPFSEPVQWYVGRTVRQLSQQQSDQLQQLTGGANARPLQERNGRAILCLGCG